MFGFNTDDEKFKSLNLGSRTPFNVTFSGKVVQNIGGLLIGGIAGACEEDRNLK